MKQRFVITVHHSRAEPIDETLANGTHVRGHRSVPLPDTQETVEVEVDFERLARVLGPQAVHSKGGKSQEASGMVVVRHVRK